MFLPGRLVSMLVPGVSPGQVQPAGVDLRVGEIHVFEGEGVLGVDERVIPPTRRLDPGPDGYWRLAPGAYRVVFMDAVWVPEGCVGFCYPRSSLLRMGATVCCAVWDPGYYGRGSALLLVFNRHGVRLRVGARIAQLVYARVYPLPGESYRGAYLGEGLRGQAPLKSFSSV